MFNVAEIILPAGIIIVFQIQMWLHEKLNTEIILK